MIVVQSKLAHIRFDSNLGFRTVNLNLSTYGRAVNKRCLHWNSSHYSAVTIQILIDHMCTLSGTPLAMLYMSENNLSDI